jgi:hypothetical protein
VGHAADAGFAGVGRYGPELKEKPIEVIMAPRSGAGLQLAMEAAGIDRNARAAELGVVLAAAAAVTALTTCRSIPRRASIAARVHG